MGIGGIRLKEMANCRCPEGRWERLGCKYRFRSYQQRDELRLWEGMRSIGRVYKISCKQSLGWKLQSPIERMGRGGVSGLTEDSPV